MQRFEDGGILYEDIGNGQVRVIGPASQQAPAPVTLGKPRPKDPPAGYNWNGGNLAPIPGGPADKPDEANKPPAGYRWTKGGGLEPIPGGPADKSDSGAKPGKPMRQGDADKLAEQVDSYAALKDAMGGFQDDFAGNKITGRLENWAQGLLDTGTPGQRQWWANFYAADNLIRNNLFGASLTEGEKQAYAQTTVDPSMSPATVKKNIEARLEIARKALERRTGRLRSTFNNDEIDAAVGEFADDFSPSRRNDQLRDELGIQIDPAMLEGQQGGGDPSLGQVGAPLYGDVNQPLGGASAAQVTMGDAFQQGRFNGTNTEMEAGATDENIVTPQDQEIAARLSKLWRGGASYDQLMQEYDSINQEYGFGGRYKPSVSGAVLKQQAGLPGRERPGFDPVATGRKSDLQNAKDYYLDGSTGALATSFLDAGGLGLTDEVAGLFGGDEAARQAQFSKDYLGDKYDGETILGSLAGGLGTTLGIQKGVMGLGGKVATSGNQTARSMATRLAGTNAAAGTTANAAYGTAYGAGSDNENRLRGAGVGLGASMLGDFAGRGIGRKVAQSGIVGKARNVARQARGKEPMRPMPKMSATDNMVVNADPNGQALDRLSTARDLQVPMTLADVTPEFRALAGATARRSPTARGMAEEAFTPRSRGQYERLIGAIDRDLGPTANIPQYSEDLIKQAQANSRPFYDEAFSAPGASSVDISGIAKTPMGQQGISNAYNSVRNTLGLDGQPIDATALGFDIAEGTGEATLNRVPSFETLDYFKKGLDDVIDAGFDPMTKQYTADARAAIQLKQNLVGQMDNVNPAYANARQAYAGPAGEREALRLGQSSGNMTPDQMQYTIKDFSPEKRAQFALGDRSRMADQAGKVRYSGNPWEAAYGSPQAQQRLAISHPDASPRFGQQYGMERDIAMSNNTILGNSMTAERQLADQAFAGNMMSDVAFDAVTTGTPLKTGATLLGRFAKDELGRFGAKKKADTLAPILFDTDISQMLDTLSALRKKPKVIKRARGILGRTAANNTGRGLGLAAPIAALPFVQE